MGKKAVSYRELDWARSVLKLGESATMKEIKRAYRESCRRWHPDQIESETRDDATKRMQKINEAYNIILKYCSEYRYSFKPGNDENFDPDSWWWNQFGEAFAGETTRDTENKKNS